MIRESAPEPFVDDATEFTFMNGQIVRMARPTHLEPCECGGPLRDADKMFVAVTQLAEQLAALTVEVRALVKRFGG